MTENHQADPARIPSDSIGFLSGAEPGEVRPFPAAEFLLDPQLRLRSVAQGSEF